MGEAESRRRLLFGVVAVLGGAAIAYALWALTAHFLFWGPLDPGTFTLGILAPIWVGGSLLGGWFWSIVDGRQRVAPAIVVWVIVGAAVAATTWWIGVSETGACETSARTPAEGWIVPAIVIGLIVGAIPAIASLLAADRFAAANARGAVLAALAANLVGFGAFGIAFTLILFTVGGCNRP